MPFNPHNLEDYLEYQALMRGEVALDDYICNGTATSLQRKLAHIRAAYLKVGMSQGDVTLFIRCEGGEVYEALSIYDMLLEQQREWLTLTAKVQAWAASAAAMIVLQAASRRIASPHSRFLIHELRSWTAFKEKKTSDQRDELKEMTALQEIVCGIMAERTGRTSQEVASWFERKEVWLSAREALDYGLIDEIEQAPPNPPSLRGHFPGGLAPT